MGASKGHLLIRYHRGALVSSSLIPVRIIQVWQGIGHQFERINIMPTAG